MKAIKNLLSIDFLDLPLHTGYFRNAFKCFQGYRVVGHSHKPGVNTECAGYVLDDESKLIAVSMPSLFDAIDEFSKVFQFNEVPPDDRELNKIRKRIEAHL